MGPRRRGSNASAKESFKSPSSSVRKVPATALRDRVRDSRCDVVVPSILPTNPKVGPASSRRGHVGSQKTFSISLYARPLYRDKVWVIDNFLTKDECAAWSQHGTAAEFEEACHSATRDTAFRDNGRIEEWDADLASRIWKRLEPFVPCHVDGLKAVGCYEKIRLYRYRAGGQRFGKHIDESNPGIENGTSTKVTVLIYLNGEESGLVGGETVFYRGAGYEEAVRFMPAAGSLLFHWHGNRCMVHEALPVKEGAKFVLRTDVLYGILSSG